MHSYVKNTKTTFLRECPYSQFNFNFFNFLIWSIFTGAAIIGVDGFICMGYGQPFPKVIDFTTTTSINVLNTFFS